MSQPDPSWTFDNFVVGPANRLAAAAARRSADSPGSSYNPLFIYSASGLGKSHILHAVANHAARAHPEFQVVYQTLEGYLNELTQALEAGERDELRRRYRKLDLLLLDDVQFLTGQAEAQEMLLRTLDSVSGGGKQIVLASDRPPAEINGLDARLLSRFSAGLIVDIGPPEYETRMAIVRKKISSRGADLSPEACEAVARFPFQNVRELQGGLNRIMAIQDLEGRKVTPEEAARVLGGGDGGGESEQDADEFFQEISQDVAATVQAREAPWRKVLRTASEAAEARGFSAARLRRLMEEEEEPEDPEGVVEEFRSDLRRLEQIKEELERLGNPWPEAALTVLKDPERLEEAEALLASARERVQPFPELGQGPDLGGLEDDYPTLAVKAAQRLISGDRPEYDPLFLSCPDPERARRVLAATGRSFLQRDPDARVALLSASEFAEDFIRALSAGVASAWRERWWTVELLLLYGVEALAETERAQDEFFHLFEALKRREARIFLSADRRPSEIENIDVRLRSRFEGGLAVEMSETVQAVGPPEPQQQPDAAEVPESPEGEKEESVASAAWGDFPPEVESEPGPASGDVDEVEVQPGGGTVAPGEAPAAPKGIVLDVPEMPSPADLVPTARSTPEGSEEEAASGWKPSREKVIWEWPRLDDLLVEED